MSASVIVIFVVALLSLRGAQAQDKKHEFDGEWVGRASSQNSDNCRPGTYQITVKDSQLAGTYDVRVKVRGNYRNDTSKVTGQIQPDGKAEIVLAAVDTNGRNSKFSGTFTGTEFQGSDTRGRCDYDVKLNRK